MDGSIDRQIDRSIEREAERDKHTHTHTEMPHLQARPMVWLATVVACSQVRNPQLMGALCGSILAAIEDLGPQNVGVLINLSGKDCAPK